MNFAMVIAWAIAVMAVLMGISIHKVEEGSYHFFCLVSNLKSAITSNVVFLGHVAVYYRVSSIIPSFVLLVIYCFANFSW